MGNEWDDLGECETRHSRAQQPNPAGQLWLGLALWRAFIPAHGKCPAFERFLPC
jgi:hypothetical protein